MTELLATTGPTWGEFVDGWELFRDPIYCAGIAGGVLGFLSVYIVLRRMVFFSAAVTQAAGLGVALAFYSGIYWASSGLEFGPVTGAVGMSLLVAGVLVVDPARTGLSRETVLGMVFAFTGGAAILVGARISQEAHDIQSILFGTGVLIMPEDLHRVALAGAAIMVLQLWWFRGIAFSSFDPIAARVQRVPVAELNAVLLVSIAVMVGVSARAIGSLPAFALSTMPGAAALLLVRGRLPVAFALATVFGAGAGVGGYIIAFFRDYPVGGTQTVLATFMVLAALLVRAAITLVARRRVTA
jgi:zinc transport system permease protein